jgi:hypothetical protein
MTESESAMEKPRKPAVILAEFDSPDTCLRAAERVRDAGYQAWDVHTPYPVHGMDAAMGLASTKLGIIAFIAGITGCISAVLMIQYMNAFDYPIIVGGKPPGAFPSMVPVMFELSILLTGFGTFFGLLHLINLPRHHHPVFFSERFETCSDDKFFISIDVKDEKFHPERTQELLVKCSPRHVELLEDTAL